jgi:DNA-directed RNA polymerase subunit RPC12/RpoP
MSDVLLKCGQCGKHLAVDPRAVGRAFHCPDCDALVPVPTPSLAFQCPSCKAGLLAIECLVGEKFDCPACRHLLDVPEESLVFCWNCSARLVMDADTYQSLAGQSTRCPQCGRMVDVPKMPKA